MNNSNGCEHPIFRSCIPDVSTSDPATTFLMYEEIDGVPYYYRDYQAALTNHKTHEEITGVSALQSAIVSMLVYILYKYLPFDDYLIATNEPGLHLAPGSNLVNDIAVFDQASLPIPLNDKYFPVDEPFASEIPIPEFGKATMWILSPKFRVLHRQRIKSGVRGFL